MISWLSLIFVAAISSGAMAQSEQRAKSARAEGEVVFYSGMIAQDTQVLLSAFQKRYPNIKATHYRARGSALVARIQNEHRAGKHVWDVFNSTGFEGYVLLNQGHFEKYDSPERKHYPEGHKDKDGRWVTMYSTPMLPSYNTRLVSSKDLPNSYDDFLNPRWKGKLGLDPQDIEWYSNLKNIWGSEKARRFIQGLAKQGVILRQGRALLTDLLGAGEFTILVNNYLANVLRVKEKGSPVDFFPLDPIVEGAGPIGINRNAPHPHAARLFFDFCLSKEGQAVLVSIGKSSARNDVPGNPSDQIRSVRMVPSDLALGKQYADNRREYEALLGIGK
jgi:iron(III) transport system substrate-binding protein